jgi:hypothetical protein
MNVIKTLSQVQQEQANAWVYGFIIAGVALAIAIGIAFLVNWRSDRKDFMTRRIWFIVIGLVLPICYWLYNMRVVVPKIQNIGFKNMFQATNNYVLISSMVAFFLVGIGLMFVFRNSKFGSILGKKK